MKAITIKQPWVHAILKEGKDIENRSWKRDFRGWLAIHSSASPRRDARYPKGYKVPPLEDLTYASICGVARVVDMVSKSQSPWFDRPRNGQKNYGWLLQDIRPLKKPIPCKGALGLWDVPAPVFRAIKQQLPRRLNI